MDSLTGIRHNEIYIIYPFEDLNSDVPRIINSLYCICNKIVHHRQQCDIMWRITIILLLLVNVDVFTQHFAVFQIALNCKIEHFRQAHMHDLLTIVELHETSENSL
ncbi:hypothetical protein D1872_273720 [compost metagenome]